MPFSNQPLNIERLLQQRLADLNQQSLPPNLQSIVAQYQQQIYPIVSSNPNSTLSPEQIKRMYELRDELYFNLRTGGYQREIPDLEMAVNARRGHDVKIVRDFADALMVFYASRNELKDIGKGKAKEALPTIIRYKDVADAYQDNDISSILAIHQTYFERYLNRFAERKAEKRRQTMKNISNIVEGTGETIGSVAEAGWEITKGAGLGIKNIAMAAAYTAAGGVVGFFIGIPAYLILYLPVGAVMEGIKGHGHVDGGDILGVSMGICAGIGAIVGFYKWVTKD